MSIRVSDECPLADCDAFPMEEHPDCDALVAFARHLLLQHDTQDVNLGFVVMPKEES